MAAGVTSAPQEGHERVRKGAFHVGKRGCDGFPPLLGSVRFLRRMWSATKHMQATIPSLQPPLPPPPTHSGVIWEQEGMSSALSYPSIIQHQTSQAAQASLSTHS